MNSVILNIQNFLLENETLGNRLADLPALFRKEIFEDCRSSFLEVMRRQSNQFPDDVLSEPAALAIMNVLSSDCFTRECFTDPQFRKFFKDQLVMTIASNLWEQKP